MVDSKTTQTIGELIRAKRTELGISLSEVSRVTGVSKGVISKVESGETKRPELRTLKPIADVLEIPCEEIIECCIEMEQRVGILDVFLSESIEISNLSLITKVANKLLESPQEDTYTLLEHLYKLANKNTNTAIRLTLYNIIITYARVHGVPMYIAKGLYQKYLIEREDLKRLEESFKVGEESLYYVDFLSDEEKITFYFRMTLHAHNTKKFAECIELCKMGLRKETPGTELKARAHLAMINSLLFLENYDEVEYHLDVFEQYPYHFVPDATKITRAIVKAKTKQFDVAIPMLQECLDEVSKDLKIHVANELFDVFFQTRDMNSIAELLTLEEECMISNPQTPYQHISIGTFYQFKGNFMMETGSLEQGKESYLLSLGTFKKVNAYQELTECMKHIFEYFSKNLMSVDIEYVKRLNEVYNGAVRRKCN
ncbi:helix-turn-helix domain-containing protein [Brevibacillus laterosporus]|uniref:helix-turn-helix domain-containing protein n=1 Tax=Brevibacillus laterosporus TaxID=1465 RepID=UPI000CE47CEF|nr:helix-turn-helix domain-containing protein [Brevibacillus laterosporus]MBG9774576.1 DNA-binding protein [Brevibacillus laterosporus]MBG9798369.1 DNA-binding protein [Brevibacillus laterosporus]MCR8937127.1 helix-turn-helix domain-containing protein [Brevibacillus laterosporus]MCZ0839765.1 helix-turn-helix domain-containing protein [Brevibacillus laterosporus]MCZ0845844.1 helix-turn-helix domain-containing protein [Brevibacillus laterosporus]